MHDLIHDLALTVAKNECSIVYFEPKNVSESLRHLSITHTVHDIPKCLDKFNSLRTILFPVYGVGPVSNSFVDKCISRFKNLRILDLSDSSFELLPDYIILTLFSLFFLCSSTFPISYSLSPSFHFSSISMSYIISISLRTC